MKTIALILIGAVFLITSLPLIQVQANGPYTVKTPIDTVYPILAGELCAFDVTARIQGVMVMKVWFDAYGNPVRSLDNYRQRWTYSANGITLKANTGGPSHITYISPTEVELRYAGAYTLVTARGKGVVFGSAGQGYETYEYQLVNVIKDENGKVIEEIYDWVMVDSTFKSGINLFWDPTEFCAALTP
jgi:hypothetical protein